MRYFALPILVVTWLSICSCTSAPTSVSPASAGLGDRVEAVSLLGEPLERDRLAPEVLGPRMVHYAEARRRYESDPKSEEAIIWLGRRAAYLGLYQRAINTYTDGLRHHPDSYRLLRHRGHRWITVRQFDRAVADLSLASRLCEDKPDAIEPDGLPNRLNQPTSTDKCNIEYHLGLAHYLRGEYAAARQAYERCLEHCVSDDMRVATSYWLWHALQRLGETEAAEAAIAPFERNTPIIENHTYLRLILLYKGDLEPASDEPIQGYDAAVSEIDALTYAYGLGAWHRANGRRERATAIFREMLETSGTWAAFGYIAAEAELARGARPAKR